jgi:hypothetical protein
VAAGSDKHILWAKAEAGSAGLPVRSYVQNAVCHEIGHSLGLTHGQAEGPCQNGHPTALDLYIVGLLHNHRDSTGPAGLP